MKKVFVVFLLLCLGAFVGLKKADPPSFTVETKKGEKIQVTKLRYEPRAGVDSISSLKSFTVHLGFGSFEVDKDLHDIKRIEVLDESGTTLKVIDTFEETLKGTRFIDPKDFISDWLRGESGKIRFSLPLREVVSITRD